MLHVTVGSIFLQLPTRPVNLPDENHFSHDAQIVRDMPNLVPGTGHLDDHFVTDVYHCFSGAAFTNALGN
jgi:hypothetical protein